MNQDHCAQPTLASEQTSGNVQMAACNYLEWVGRAYWREEVCFEDFHAGRSYSDAAERINSRLLNEFLMKYGASSGQGCVIFAIKHGLLFEIESFTCLGCTPSVTFSASDIGTML